ncbi:serine-rich adhesin for platelets [Biomphalaria pfeifferi]|uniref:Serine-rich adhesin for platelets n=1 Tax=Biomphalaria pfeifferi TaxID=112525 RepID=A0AAD8FHZ2_BIOPF|nr:serine-rich adhesin for platelets [Biomphalaria pfeifferi]
MSSSEESKCAEDSTATLLFCRLCQAVYRQPKILPCLHSFCRPCLVSAVSHTAGRGTVIVCPVCSNEAKLPPNGIVGVPDNCFLNRLCQEYVSEVQTHLVARSLHSGQETSAKPSEFSSLRTRLSDELSHPKFSPSTSPNRSASSRPSSVSSSSEDPTDSGAGDVFSDRSSVTSKGTSASALEAIRNMSRIQTKIMNLQGEALRVTYAIDHVNQCMIDWHQNREDLRKTVQRRAAQYQFFIKRLEHQLITQIDSKAADDTFYAESDKSKSELRKNLKNILYEVSVLKSIQERGMDEEINTLSASILGKSVGMNEVSMKKLHYEMNVPTRSIEEIVNESFGKINLLSESTSVFSPEIIDFTDIAMGSTSEEGATHEQTKVNIDERLEMFTEEDVEENRRSKRRSNEKRSRRHNTDLGLNSTEVQDYLAQFQTARETFRNRRREILLQGQMAREDASPVRNEVRPRPRSSSRNGRVQSLDRSAMPITRGRSSLPGLQTTRANVATVLETGSTGVYTASMRPTDISLPSPVIEEASIPSSPVRSLVKQISDPRHYRPDISSPSSDIAAPILENQVLGEGGTHSSRRHSSDQLSPLLSPLMQQGRNSVDLLDRTSRPIRRALSAAGDRKSKMEFLRENWQRRKELLIQNEGFVSPESQQIKAAVVPVIKSPPISPVLTHTATRTQSFSLQPKPKEASVLSPPASPDDVKLGPMQQLRSRLSHFRQIIGTNGGAKIKSEEEKSPEAILKPTVPVLSQEVRSSETAISTATDAVSPVIRTSLSNVSNIRGQTTDSQESSAATPSSSIQTSTVSSQDITPETVSSKVLSAPVTSAESSPTIVTTTQPPSASTPTTTTTGYVSRYGIRSPSTVSSTTTTSSYTSRYSSYSKPATDSFDVAAMIAAMYSGNEKAIISTKKSEPTSTATTSSNTATSSTTSTTNVSTSNSAPSSTATSVVTTTASDVPTTTSSSYAPYVGRYTRYTTSRDYTQTSSATPSTLSSSLSSPSTIPTSNAFSEKSSGRASITDTSRTDSSKTASSGPINTSSSLRSSAWRAGILTPDTSSTKSDVTTLTAKSDVITLTSTISPLPSSSTTEKDDTTKLDTSQTGTPASEQQRFKLESRRSRYTGQGFNRRHTIEVGKSDIQAALALQSQRQPVLNPSSLPPVVESDQQEDLISTTFHVGERRVAPRFIPAPLNLEPLQEGETTEKDSPLKTPSKLTAAVAALKSPSMSPTSPDSSTIKGKLRDIARKKKERWRHLTIH